MAKNVFLLFLKYYLDLDFQNIVSDLFGFEFLEYIFEFRFSQHFFKLLIFEFLF